MCTQIVKLKARSGAIIHWILNNYPVIIYKHSTKILYTITPQSSFIEQEASQKNKMYESSLKRRAPPIERTK